MVNIASITTAAPLTFEISLKDTSFHISMNFLGFYLSRMVVEFSLKPVYSLCLGKIFKYLVFTFLENALYLSIFAYAPPHLLILPGSVFFEILFPLAAKRGGGSYNLLYQNSTRNHDLK